LSSFSAIRNAKATSRSPSSNDKMSKLLSRMPWPGFEPRYIHLCVCEFIMSLSFRLSTQKKCKSNYLKHCHHVHVGFIGGVHGHNYQKIVKRLNKFEMRQKYTMNTSIRTLCYGDINIFVLLQLWDYILHLRLIISALPFDFFYVHCILALYLSDTLVFFPSNSSK